MEAQLAQSVSCNGTIRRLTFVRQFTATRPDNTLGRRSCLVKFPALRWPPSMTSFFISKRRLVTSDFMTSGKSRRFQSFLSQLVLVVTLKSTLHLLIGKNNDE